MNDTPILTAILNLTRVIENFNHNLTSALSGHTPPKQAPTLYTWLSDYLDIYRRKFQSPAVYAGNLNRIEKNIKPHLPDKPLDGYGTGELQTFLNRYENTPNAQKKLAVLLGGAFQKAFDTGSISFNPFKAVELVRHAPNNFPALQPDDQIKILGHAREPYHSLFLFCCCTGMRLGEAFSITAADIDYRRNVLSIPLPDTSKKKHRREIPFLPELLPPALSGKLFRMSQPAAQTYFKRLFKTLGINAVPHSFRHTFISVCNAVGVPIKQIQVWAGHRSITTTMNVYAHILDRKDTPISDYLKRLKNAFGI